MLETDTISPTVYMYTHGHVDHPPEPGWFRPGPVTCVDLGPRLADAGVLAWDLHVRADAAQHRFVWRLFVNCDAPGPAAARALWLTMPVEAQTDGTEEHRVIRSVYDPALVPVSINRLPCSNM